MFIRCEQVTAVVRTLDIEKPPIALTEEGWLSCDPFRCRSGHIPFAGTTLPGKAGWIFLRSRAPMETIADYFRRMSD
jgi:hypothetical protein